MRVIRQREVQRENECFFQVLREALPPGSVRDEAFYAIPPQKVPCKYCGYGPLFFVCCPIRIEHFILALVLQVVMTVPMEP